MEPPKLLEFTHRDTLTYSLASHPSWAWFFTEPSEAILPDLLPSHEPKTSPASWDHALSELRRSSQDSDSSSNTSSSGTATPILSPPLSGGGNTIWPKPQTNGLFRERNALSRPLYRLFADYEAKLRGEQQQSMRKKGKGKGKGPSKRQFSQNEGKSAPHQPVKSQRHGKKKAKSHPHAAKSSLRQPATTQVKGKNKRQSRAKPSAPYGNELPKRGTWAGHPKLAISSVEYGHIVPDWREHVKFDDEGRKIAVKDWLPMSERSRAKDGRLTSPTLSPQEHPATMKAVQPTSPPPTHPFPPCPNPTDDSHDRAQPHPGPGTGTQPPDSPRLISPRPPNATRLGRMVISSAATGHIVPGDERRDVRFEDEEEEEEEDEEEEEEEWFAVEEGGRSNYYDHAYNYAYRSFLFSAPTAEELSMAMEGEDREWSDAEATIDEGGTNSFYYSSSSASSASSSSSSSSSESGSGSVDSSDDSDSNEGDSESDDTSASSASSADQVDTGLGSESRSESESGSESGSEFESESESMSSGEETADVSSESEDEWSWIGIPIPASISTATATHSLPATYEAATAETDPPHALTFENPTPPPQPLPLPHPQHPPQSRLSSVLAHISARLFLGAVRADDEGVDDEGEGEIGDGGAPELVRDEDEAGEVGGGEWVVVGRRSEEEEEDWGA